MEKEEIVPEIQETRREDTLSSRNLEKADDEVLDRLILDSTMNKYDSILLARRWAYELKGQEAYRALSIQELIPQAVKDILTGKISPKTVMALPNLKLTLKKQQQKSSAAQVLGNIPTGDDSDDDSEKSGKSSKKKS